MNCPIYIQYVTKYIYGGEAILERTAVELVRTRLIKIQLISLRTIDFGQYVEMESLEVIAVASFPHVEIVY